MSDTFAVYPRYGLFYKVTIPSKYSQNEISNEIKLRGLVIISNNTKIKLSGMDNIELNVQVLNKDDFKKLVSVGKISDIVNILERFDFLEFKPYMKYNDYYPESILIKNWNRGYRIMFKHNYCQGDGTNMVWGNSILKYKTDDWEPPADEPEKANFWKHSYVKCQNGLYNEYSGNGYVDRDLFLKLR